MPAYLIAKCPHCSVPKISLEIAQVRADPSLPFDCFANLFCQNCQKPIGVRLKAYNPSLSPQATVPSPFGGNMVRVMPPPAGDILKAGWQVDEIWPDYPRPQLPDHLPDEVARPFLAAERNFPEPGMEEASAGSYGRALDVATKLSAPQHAGQKLNNRIDKMRKDNLITPSLAEWAHQIKSIRNDALHDVGIIDRKELEAVRAFTETLLTYLYTLPEMLKKLREETAAGLTEPEGGVESAAGT